MSGPLYLLGIVLSISACDEPSELGGQYQIIDSAGVRLVVSEIPVWPDGEGWTVRTRPEVTIGELSGDLPYTFERIRDVGLMADGTIYVSDEGASQVRLFEPDGGWIASVGRSGEGPGELGWIYDAGPYRVDSLWVYDYGNRQVSVFGPSPEYPFGRRVRVEYEPLENYWVRDVFSDGSFLLYSPGHTMMPGAVGLREDSTLLLAMHPPGETVDTLAAIRVIQKYVGADGRSRAVEMSPHASVRAAGERVYLTEGGAVQFQVYHRDGVLTQIARREWDPEPVTAERREEYIDRYIEHLEVRGLTEVSIDEVRERKESAEHWAEVVPAVADLLVDATDHVWLGRYISLGVPPTDWDVFDPEGRWLGTVKTPDDLTVLAITETHVLGVRTGEYGVEYIQIHRLRRST